MAENYYPEMDDGMMGGEDMGMDKEMMGQDEEGKQAEEGMTSLVPLSMFKGQELKPGDTFSGKVVHVYEDEVEVSLQPPATEEQPSAPSSTMPDNEELDALAKE